MKHQDVSTLACDKRIEHAEERTAQAEARTEQAETRTEQAETRTEQAETRTEQAVTRTEQAVTRTEQAVTRIEHAQTRTEHAETRTEQAVTRTERADTRTQQAETQTEQANTRAERAEARSLAAINASELRYRRLIETAQDGILILDADTGRVVDANPSMGKLLGYSREELLGKKLWEIGPFKGEWASEPAFAELRHTNCIRYEGLALETKDGRQVRVELSTTAYLEEEKALIQCNIRDITERKLAEEALRDSENLLRESQIIARLGSYVMSIPDGSWNSSDVLDGILGIDGAYERSAEGWAALIHPDDRAMMADAFGNEALAHGRPFDKEYRIICHDCGAERWVHGAGKLEFDGRGRPVKMRGTIQDITERKKAEHEHRRVEVQLRESQKMEALGTLAGGIAHDFNNIVAVIMGNVELARRDVGPEHPALESLEEIRKASRRAKDLVGQILTFGRRHVSSRKVVSLAPVVEEAGRLLRTTLPAGISLTVECAEDAPTVLADSNQIERVILNLCGNSLYAIQGGMRPGIIEVRLEAHEEAPAGTQHSPAAVLYGDPLSGRYARLTVRDNGSGMDKDTLARIFEPFFTTKPAGDGTGLGLAVVHGIVHDHGASVEVQSTAEDGSTFRVYFPAVGAPVPAAAAQLVDSAPAVHGQGEHVLFVDDDEAIVFLMKRLLERQGFRVSAHTDPKAAIAVARAAPDQFDLAVVDYNMPGMSGLEVARELRKIRADLPVAVASGNISEELRAQAPEAGVCELLNKPDTVDDLCAAVARLARTPRA